MTMSRRKLRLDKELLFRDLGYEPHPGQLAVHRSNAPRRILACGARWGKSTCAMMEGIAAVLEPAETSLGWIVGPSYGLADRIFCQIQEILETRLAHRLEEVSPREHRLVVRNLGGGRSELRTRSADHAVSLLGEGLDWLIVDEAAQLKATIWESYLSQLLSELL